MAREKRRDRTGEFQRRLLRWYRAARRDFPWRRAPSAYRVWISEIMLQQTRAAAVVPYYRRFLRAFPSLAALARAPAERVLRAWSGLGYYRRARHLHRAAKILVNGCGGRFPATLEAARALPGVGEYTARAILSIAYGRPLAVLDGNVARVIARREAIAGDLRLPARWEQLQNIADRWLCRDTPGDWNQAMMELGATICTPRQPRCGACPVRAGCQAFRRGLADRLPERRRKRAPVRLRIVAAVLLDARHRTLLVRPDPREFLASSSVREGFPRPPSNPRGRAAPGGSENELTPIFSRLWHFPALASACDGQRRLERSLLAAPSPSPWRWHALPPVRHTVTYRQITIEPWLVFVDSLPSPARSRAVPLDRVARLAVSSASRKIAAAALLRVTKMADDGRL